MVFKGINKITKKVLFMHCYWQQFLTQQKLFYYVTLQLFMTCLSCLVNGPCVSFLCCFSVGVYSYCNCYYCQQLGGGGFCMLCTQTLAVYSLRFMMNTKGALFLILVKMHWKRS